MSTHPTNEELKSDAKVTDLEPVWITGIPIPPSSNGQYSPWMDRRTGKMSFIPSKGLTQYKKDFDSVFYRNRAQFLQNVKKLKTWVDLGIYLDVKATFFFEKSQVFTLKKQPKKMDVQNREKALLDGLSRHLQIDDSLFFRVSAEKRIATVSQPVCVCLEIRPYFCE